MKLHTILLIVTGLISQSNFAATYESSWECAAVKRTADLESEKTQKITKIELQKTSFGQLSAQLDGLTFQVLTMNESIMTEAMAAVSIFTHPMDTTSSSGHDFAHILKTQLDPQNGEARNYIVACINRDIHPDSSTREGAQFQRMLDSIN